MIAWLYGFLFPARAEIKESLKKFCALNNCLQYVEGDLAEACFQEMCLVARTMIETVPERKIPRKFRSVLKDCSEMYDAKLTLASIREFADF